MIHAKKDMGSVMIEDPRPAGCEVHEGIVTFSGASCSHINMRDDRCVFFFTDLPAMRMS